MLLVALSCLQGRPMQAAFDELLPLVGGVQLTPGNAATPGFDAHVAARAAAGAHVLAHHGFAYGARRTRVWGADARPLVANRSVHAPQLDGIGRDAREGSFADLCAATAAGWLAAAGVVLETMYPGFALGSGAELAWAMAARLPLAVDISHLAIQRAAGVLDDGVLAAIFDYDRVAEVHVSQSDGVHDRHLPLTPATFGLAWARARLAAGTPVVLECYMHRLAHTERRRQIDAMLG